MTINSLRQAAAESALPVTTEADVERSMAFADAALGAAGHAVTDPELRELRRRAIRKEITPEDAIAAGFALIDSRKV